jgi:hypothetical protein
MINLNDRPKYSKGQKVFVNGKEYVVNGPVWMSSMNCLTMEETYIGIYYRLDGYPQDVQEDQISITPEEAIKYEPIW